MDGYRRRVVDTELDKLLTALDGYLDRIVDADLPQPSERRCREGAGPIVLESFSRGRIEPGRRVYILSERAAISHRLDLVMRDKFECLAA